MRRQLLKNCGKVEVLQVIFGYGIARSSMTDILLLGIPLLINIYWRFINLQGSGSYTQAMDVTRVFCGWKSSGFWYLCYWISQRSKSISPLCRSGGNVGTYKGGNGVWFDNSNAATPVVVYVSICWMLMAWNWKPRYVDGIVTVLCRCHSCDTQKQPLGDVFQLQVFESNSAVKRRVIQMPGFH